MTEWSKAGSSHSSSVSQDKYWKLAVSWAGVLLYHGYIIRMNSASTTTFTVVNIICPTHTRYTRKINCISLGLVG